MASSGYYPEKSSEKKVVSAQPSAPSAPSVSQALPSYAYAASPYVNNAAITAHGQYAGLQKNSASHYSTNPGYVYPQEPPPPYSVALSQPTTAGTMPGYYSYPQMGYAYPYSTQALPSGIMYPPTQYVVPQGGYDAGARFDGIARPSIPPVPPGVQPTAAQLAMMQGTSNIAMTQRQANAFYSDAGGFTFW